MIKKCAWCKKDKGVTEDHEEGDQTITDGICKECREKFEKEARRSKPKD